MQGLFYIFILPLLITEILKQSIMWRTPKGIELFSPRHFGFDLDYVPIEEIQKKRKKFD